MSVESKSVVFDPNPSNIDEQNKNTKKRKLSNIQIDKHIRVRDLNFGSIICALDILYSQFVKNVPYGGVFNAYTPILNKLLCHLRKIYQEYDEQFFDESLWNKQIKVCPINGDKKMFTLTKKGANIVIILKLVCAQIRKINEGDLLIKGDVNSVSSLLQAEFDYLCTNILGRRLTKEKLITTEPVIYELFDAFIKVRDASNVKRGRK